jgi:hypothetical protein
VGRQGGRESVGGSVCERVCEKAEGQCVRERGVAVSV